MLLFYLSIVCCWKLSTPQQRCLCWIDWTTTHCKQRVCALLGLSLSFSSPLQTTFWGIVNGSSIMVVAAAAAAAALLDGLASQLWVPHHYRHHHRHMLMQWKKTAKQKQQQICKTHSSFSSWAAGTYYYIETFKQQQKQQIWALSVRRLSTFWLFFLPSLSFFPPRSITHSEILCFHSEKCKLCRQRWD